MAVHEPLEAPTQRHADFKQWVKQLATAVFDALRVTGHYRTIKLNEVPCASLTESRARRRSYAVRDRRGGGVGDR